MRAAYPASVHRAATVMGRAAVVMAALAFAACGPISSTTTEPTVSSAGATVTSPPGADATRAVCDAERRVLHIVNQATAKALTSAGHLVTRIGRVQSTLQTTADQFRADGQTDTADRITELADAVGAFKQAVAERSTAAIIAAAAKIGPAVKRVAVCTHPSASP
jgi:hypothetical protein